jgi:hypothetical protein
LQWDPWQ